MFKLILLSILLGLLLWFFSEITLFYIISPKGYKAPNVYKPYGFFHKVFLDFPRQFGKDLAARNVNFFNASGLIIFEGRQGSGKTISAVRECSLLKARFPECKVYSNTELIFQDGGLVDWKPLTQLDNGIYGMVYLLDEISIWFNNRNWKGSNGRGGFPPEMLQVVTQNRKCKRLIIGTAQSAQMCDKTIRMQANYFVKCGTILGCITWQNWRVPEWDSDGNLVKMHFKRFTWFVQSDFLRSCYDTFATIKTLDSVGIEVQNEVKIQL